MRLFFLFLSLLQLTSCLGQEEDSLASDRNIFIGNPFSGGGFNKPTTSYGGQQTGSGTYGIGDGNDEMSNGQAPPVNPYPTVKRCITTGYGCYNSTDCCSNGCDIFSPEGAKCCLPEGRACDFARPTAGNNYACCYPLFCAPYRDTELTVCQETSHRWPGFDGSHGTPQAANNMG